MHDMQFFFFSSRRRHTRWPRDWSSDVCSSDLGAQIGGATDGNNLVPGLYVTNSFMIPYETMVMQYARADPTNFFAHFRVSPTGTLFARYISIEITAKGHKMLGDLEPTLLGRFDVLLGKVVDKLSNEIIKRNLDRRAAF